MNHIARHRLLYAAEVRRLLAAGDPHAAAELCKRGLIHFPEDHTGYVLLADAFLALGQSERALNVLADGYRRTGSARLNALHTALATGNVPTSPSQSVVETPPAQDDPVIAPEPFPENIDDDVSPADEPATDAAPEWNGEIEISEFEPEDEATVPAEEEPVLSALLNEDVVPDVVVSEEEIASLEADWTGEIEISEFEPDEEEGSGLDTLDEMQAAIAVAMAQVQSFSIPAIEDEGETTNPVAEATQTTAETPVVAEAQSESPDTATPETVAPELVAEPTTDETEVIASIAPEPVVEPATEATGTPASVALKPAATEPNAELASEPLETSASVDAEPAMAASPEMSEIVTPPSPEISEISDPTEESESVADAMPAPLVESIAEEPEAAEPNVVAVEPETIADDMLPTADAPAEPTSLDALDAPEHPDVLEHADVPDMDAATDVPDAEDVAPVTEAAAGVSDMNTAEETVGTPESAPVTEPEPATIAAAADADLSSDETAPADVEPAEEATPVIVADIQPEIPEAATQQEATGKRSEGPAESRSTGAAGAPAERPRTLSLALHTVRNATRLRSSNLRLIPGLEFAPLRHEDNSRRQSIAPLINEPMPQPELPRRAVKGASDAMPPLPELESDAATPTLQPVHHEATSTENAELRRAARPAPSPMFQGGAGGGNEELSPLEELARRLERARIPVIEEVDQRTAFEPSLMSETLANILVAQGAYAEALAAFQTLALSTPERREHYQQRIEEMQRQLNQSNT